VPDRAGPVPGGNQPAAGQAIGDTVLKSRRHLSWDNAEKLARLLISAVEPVARLIDAISRIR
jgi:hypothetical protein